MANITTSLQLGKAEVLSSLRNMDRTLHHSKMEERGEGKGTRKSQAFRLPRSETIRV